MTKPPGRGHDAHRSDPASWGVRRDDDRPSRLYRGLRGTIRLAMRAFYRTVEVTGREHIDGRRPTILASTHPNSIVDPLLLGVFEARQVAFCARDGLFKVPIFGRILSAVGAIPISRPSDRAEGDAVDNSDAFKACREVLQNEGVISIFPEGKTHDTLKVHRIKTGTARIALDAEQASGYTLGVRIVPVGLNYLVRQAFRSDVHVAFGTPIEVSAFQASAEADPRAAVRELTDRIGAALKDLAIHVEETEDERIIAQVTAIVVDIRAQQGLDGGGQTPAQRTALVRRIVDAYRWYQETEPDATAVLRRRFQRFVEERSALGLGGDTVALQHRTEQHRHQDSPWRRRRRFLTLGAPVAAYGFAQNAAPYIVLRTALRVMRPRKDRRALTKLLLGTLSFGGFWGTQVALVGTLLGPVVGLVYAITLPASSVFALRYMTEARLHRITWSAIRALFVEGDRLDALREEREALKGELTRLRDGYLAHLDAMGISAI